MTTDKATKTLEAKELPIRAVIVYVNRARVERVLSVNLQEGTNEIIIEKFPAAMESDSLRVDTASSSLEVGISIRDVNIAFIPERRKTSRFANIPELEGLSDDQKAEHAALARRKDQLTTRITALEKSAGLFHGYADRLLHPRMILAPSAGTSDDKADESLSSLQKLDEFVAVYPEKLQALLEKHQDAQEELDGVQRDIDDLLEKGKQSRGKNPDWSVYSFAPLSKPTVTILLESAVEGEAELLVSYLVSGPSWTGSYDIHASLPHAKSEAAPSITLIYRASISQHTGESWDDVQLTLSTVSPSSSLSVPQLHPWRIGSTNTGDPALQAVALKPNQKLDPLGALHQRSAAANPFGAFGSTGAAQQQAAVVPNSGSSPFAVVDCDAPKLTQHPYLTGQLQVLTSKGRGEVMGGTGSTVATIEVEGKSSIPRDGSHHKVLITTLTLDADMEWMTVPKHLAAAFLQCRVKNTSDFTLIRGPSQVFFDGNFVAKSTIPDVSPEESFACSLGIDPSVKITYHPQRRLARTDKAGGMPWYSSSKSTDVKAYTSRITVKNLRKTPLSRLVLKDQIPVSEDERIKVKMINPSADAIGPVAPLDPTSVGDKSKPGASTRGEGITDPVWANVKPGVRARWAQKSERDGGTGGSRGDGVVEWWCEDVKGELDIELAWEVESPHDVA